MTFRSKRKGKPKKVEKEVVKDESNEEVNEVKPVEKVENGDNVHESETPTGKKCYLE